LHFQVESANDKWKMRNEKWKIVFKRLRWS
jgi:hypothetical protein